ncbi:MAG: ABC transporter permease subunit [Chloroflexota bacterium]
MTIQQASLQRLATAGWPLHSLLSHLQFIGRRLLFGLLVLLAIIFLSYLGLDMAEGVALGEALPEAVGQSFTHAGRLLRGDLGLTTATTSASLPLPVIEVLPDLLGRSLGLLGISLLFATLVGVGLGIRAATRQQSGRSLTILLISLIGMSAPSFFIALLLQMAAVSWTRWTGRMLLPLGGFGWDKHLILPAVVLAARPIAQITRVTYIAIGEALRQDFVRTAHGKGLRRYTILYRHVFRYAAVPILTTIGVSLRFSLSSLPVVEFFLSWPGVGFTLLRAVAEREYNLTIAMLLSLGLLFILVNLLLELVYRFIDPRLRDVPDYIGREEGGWKKGLKELRELARELPAALREWLAGLSNRRPVFGRRKRASSPSPSEGEGQGMRAALRPWLRGTLGNFPFLLGSILVLGLLVVVIYGPQLAPLSPYTTQGITYKDGVFSVPPFEPNETYHWGSDVLGRDLFSLVLAGAQQTLLLAVLAVLARVLLGTLLGALAGWRHGRWLDRLILGTAEVIAAFPTLLLAMLLILGLGIRQGMRPFLIAFCLVGWAEIMQFVRGQVLAIRPQPYIESAVAVGLRTPGIIFRHVLPNLLPALISLAALEMGAVLMLLGELGFIGIFIGGGAFAELDVAANPYHYSDVPEWGSLLSNVRPFARTYTWTAFYPALVFFVAILSFNLFGEGLRRLIEKVGVGFTRLFNRYTLALGVVALLAAGWVRENTGSIAFYRQQAAVFDGERALAHVQALTAAEMEGRAFGSQGLGRAAGYVQEQFEALGLQAAGEGFSYFQPHQRTYAKLDGVPQLVIEDGRGSSVYHQDFVELAWLFRNQGHVRAPVRFVAFGDVTSARGFSGRPNFALLPNLDYSNEILLVLTPLDAFTLQYFPRGGILLVTDDPSVLDRRFTLSTRDPIITSFGTGRQVGQDAPMMVISEATADRLLQSTGRTVADLRRETESLGQDERLEIPTHVTAAMNVPAAPQDEMEIAHVVGHLPGASDQLDANLIIVMAQYDHAAAGADGLLYPGANDNASGVAVMLEAIRAMQESGFQPYKSFLFVAYSGEGTEGGNQVFPPDFEDFLEGRIGFVTAFDVEAVVEVRGVGAGEGNELMVSSGGSLRLADLFERAAGQMDAPLERARDPVNISIVFDENALFTQGQEAPQITMNWEGWEMTSHTTADTYDTISAERLRAAGRTLALALMLLGRETQY